MSDVTTLSQSIKVEVLKSKILNELVSKIQSFPAYTTLKKDIEVILFVCNAIENYSIKKKYKIDKKALAINVLNQAFSLNDEEQAILDKHIQFLWNSKMIQKLKNSIILFRSVKSYVIKKIL